MPDEIRMIDCTTAVRQLWDFLDEELDDKRMAEVRQHLALCRDCLPHAEFGRRFLQALSRARERHVMPPAVRSQVIAALTEAGFFVRLEVGQRGERTGLDIGGGGI